MGWGKVSDEDLAGSADCSPPRKEKEKVFRLCLRKLFYKGPDARGPAAH